MISVIKRLVLRFTPFVVLQQLKQVYYPIALRKTKLEEEPDLKAVQGLIRSGDCVIDIGANVGVYTKFLSEFVGPRGFVYSVEPIPSTYKILCSVVRDLDLLNVKIINCAVSDSPRMVSMEIPKYEKGGSNFYRAHIVNGGSQAEAEVKNTRNAATINYDIKAETCDVLFAWVPERIAFLKIDVEGVELEVIKGAEKIFEKFSPAWLIEVSDDPDSQTSKAFELFKLFSERGYQAYWFDGEVLRLRRAGDTTINYFFLNEEFIERAASSGLMPKE